MLVHIPSGGVLYKRWTGEYHQDYSATSFTRTRSSYKMEIKNVPVYEECFFYNTSICDDKENWIELNGSSDLGKKIERLYPNIRLCFDKNGNLYDVKDIEQERQKKIKSATDSNKKKRLAEKGYKNNYSRPRNMATFCKLK